MSHQDGGQFSAAASDAAPGIPLARHTCLVFSTKGIAPAERLDYWRQTVLRRMEPVRAINKKTPFNGRMTRLTAESVELVEHAADSLLIARSQRQCRQDGCDDISIGFILAGMSWHPEYGRKLHPGDINIIDCTLPVNARLSRHRTMSLVLRRQRVRDILGSDPSAVANLRLANTGMTVLLRAHMQSTLEQMLHLSPAERALALDVAAEMAGAAIQSALARAPDADQFPRGLRQAAMALIARSCMDPELTPLRVATDLGCSRASLYRVFRGTGGSPSALIWAARLSRAHAMLTSAAHANSSIGEIAFHSGFIDHATFDRMFKRRYAMTPREARLSAESPVS